MTKKKRGRPKKPRITKQRVKLLKGLEEGDTLTKAGKDAGYSSVQAAHNAMSLVKIRFPEIFARLGCPADRILKKYVDKLEATKKTHHAHQGIVMETSEDEDHGIQIDAADRIRDIMGLDTRTLLGDDERRRDSAFNAARPGGTAISVVLPNAEAAREFVDALAAVAAHSRRPVLDAVPHEDDGRAGPGEPVQTIPD